jgi:glucose-6-phosphate isomerase, archaeal
MNTLLNIDPLGWGYDPDTGSLTGSKVQRRFLSDLKGIFADSSAYDATLAAANPLVYEVSGIEPAVGPGDLHFGIGVLHPGKVGEEYYMTKGHYHTRREAAELYVGFRGKGCMLLEDESTGESRIVKLGEGKIVYVPGYTAHRTINTGTEPLVYIGIYPADAGHDYASIAINNFRQMVCCRNGQAVMVSRS